MKPHPARRIVMHLDMDCYFAAVEEREDPRLKGRPVVIGSDPMGGRGRGIVATANYPARRFGIHSAMPISTAWRLCPKAVFLRPRFRLYSEVSRSVMELLRDRADVLEVVGIDEAYLDASSQGTFEAARRLALDIRAEIARRHRLSASIGVGPNRLIAKIASDHKKPAGLTVVLPGRVAEFLGPKGVRALRGVGPKTEERLKSMGYRTVAGLRGAAESRLRAAFGKFGPELYRQARGIDESPVDPDWEAKSIGRENTFLEDTGDHDEVRRTLLDCVRRVHADMRGERVWCHTLAVKVRFEGYETHSRQTTMRLSTGSLPHLERGALSLIDPFLGGARRVRLVGFSVSRLVPPEELLPFG